MQVFAFRNVFWCVYIRLLFHMSRSVSYVRIPINIYQDKNHWAVFMSLHQYIHTCIHLVHLYQITLWAMLLYTCTAWKMMINKPVLVGVAHWIFFNMLQRITYTISENIIRKLFFYLTCSSQVTLSWTLVIFWHC